MTSWTSLLETLDALKAAVEWRQAASNLLVEHRRVDESDMATLERVLADYQAMRLMVFANTTLTEHEAMDRKGHHAVTIGLSKILARVRNEPLADQAAIAQNKV